MASNIGKKPVQIETGTNVAVNGDSMVVTGPKGQLSARIPHGIQLEVSEGTVVVKKMHNAKYLEKFYGLSRALLANMVIGVNKGFEKKLELSGVGYRAKVEGMDLVLNVGFANPVKIKAPEGIQFSVAENVITVAGIDKSLVGNTAAKIREVRVPDPYKAKGIKYQGEHIRRKVGKAAKAVGAK